MAATIPWSEALPLFPMHCPKFQSTNQAASPQNLQPVWGASCDDLELHLIVLHPFSDASQNNPMDRSGEVDPPSLFWPFLTRARSELCPGLSPRQLVLYQQLIDYELSWLKDSLSLPLRYSYMRSHRLAQAEDVPKEAIIWGWPSSGLCRLASLIAWGAKWWTLTSSSWPTRKNSRSRRHLP